VSRHNGTRRVYEVLDYHSSVTFQNIWTREHTSATGSKSYWRWRLGQRDRGGRESCSESDDKLCTPTSNGAGYSTRSSRRLNGLWVIDSK